MSDAYVKSYDKRVREINKKHRKMAQGVVHSINHDGLIIARPRRRGPRLPWKGIALMVAGFFLFKAFLLINLGPQGFEDRVAALNAGTTFEQVGSYVMALDPVTEFLAEQIRGLLP